MAINLSNVNISIDEFQRIASGKHNAGEVKLAGAHKLDKMNNHVKHTEKNNERISHVEVVAIKQSLVKALSQNGVGQDEINRIRKDLGLAPKDAADKDLLARSVVPLTRQQIRAILDRNAASINAFNAQHHPGGAVLRASTQIYGPGGMDETLAAKRDAVNAALADKNRTLDVNWEISRFEKVVSDYVDYNTPEERAKLLAVAEKQLDQLMQTCHCRPREDHAATATLELAGGQVISMPTGMSEKAFAERLENIIVRFKGRLAGPDEVERGLLKDFRALGSAQDKQVFLAELPNGPQYGLKARSLAVQCLYSRRVADYATLSLANRLGANDALSLATAILNMPKDATPDQIRANAVLTALAAKAPVAVPDNEKAYVPATSNTQYNEFVLMSLRTSPEKLLPAHRNLAEEVKMEVRLRLGEVAMPGETEVRAIVDDLRMAGIYFDGPAAWEARRNTAETIRESYLAAALEQGALLIATDEMKKAILAAGGNPVNVWSAVRGLEERNGDFIRTLAAAGTPEQARLIVAEHRDEIARQARLYCKAAPLKLNLRENAIQALAAKLGAGPDTIRAIWNTQDTGIIRAISKAGSDLMDKILSGEVRAETDAEVEAAFASLVERRIAALAAALKQVDDLNPPLPLHVADNIKAKLCDLQKFDYVNVERIIREVANRADTAQLEELLRGNADKVAIQNELRRLSTAINNLTHGMLAGKEEIGPDDKDGIMTIAGVLLVSGRPGLADKLDAFFLRPDVKAEIEENNLDNPATVAMNYFRETSFRQDIFAGGPFEASRIRSLFAEPREMAAFKAAGGEGRAVYAGYHAKDMPMLARCFALVKAARHDSDEEALRAVLDPTSLVRQLFEYGGRFIENPGNFRQGLALMTQFRLWFIDQVEARGQHRTDTPTLLNGRANVLSADCTRSMEKFVLEEIAHNPGMDLADENSENLFGMANNKAMRLVGLGYMNGCYGTLTAMPPQKRALLCDVVDVFSGPLAATQAELDAKREIGYNGLFVARVLKHLDEIEELKEAGQLDRAHLVPLLYGDFGVAGDATNPQIDDAFSAAQEELPPGQDFLVHIMAAVTGATWPECKAAFERGEQLPQAPYIVAFSPELKEVVDPDGGRKTMLGDINRPANAMREADEEPVLPEENVRFRFNFPDRTTRVAAIGLDDAPDVVAANNAIADKIERLCGKVHAKQISAVCYAISQSGAGSKVKSAFVQQGIRNDEHMALTFTLAKDDATGAVTVLCSEPKGFKDSGGHPIHFHWTTTVALDGTVTSTPMVVEP